MTRYMIFPYTQGSKGAKALAEELGGKRILREGSTYVPAPGDVIINWGASDCHQRFPQALNARTYDVTNKNKFFKRLDGTGLTPPSCTTKAGAAGMNFPVFCRTQVEGRDGAGIVIANNPSELVDAKLYVESRQKTTEYRVHVGRLSSGELTLIGAQKKWVPDMSALANPQVWTGDGTKFIWKPNGQPLILPPAVWQVCMKAFEKFPELTFGAFDAIYHAPSETAYVLEINSAPMMTPETAKRYGQFFRSFVGSNVVGGQATTVAAASAPPSIEEIHLTVSFPAPSLTMVQQILSAIPGVTIQ
jgi:hypothetical protein